MLLDKAISLSYLCLCLLNGPCYGKIQPAENTMDTPGFAVVELFTSEGCSSCPAAEAALAQVHGEYKQNVYVLEFHVDYWDNIGWKDVFSSREYTDRQQQYARLFHLNSIYTPQAIVNGADELAGSDKTKLHALIDARMLEKPANTIRLSATANNGNVSIAYKITDARRQLLNIALVQKESETNVKRGENAGRKLPHINMVRALKTIGPGQNEGSINIPLPAGLSSTDCTIVAYTQDQDKWKVTAAAAAMIN